MTIEVALRLLEIAAKVFSAPNISGARWENVVRETIKLYNELLRSEQNQ